MNTMQPIYTEKARCQDCYRCVRNCPVKAIRIDHGVASVVEELCIHCGKCVNICPAGAKKVRDDLTEVARMLEEEPMVIASVAPSYVAEFPGMNEERLVYALENCGFYGVSETALGAQEVSANAAALLADDTGNEIRISTACPAVVRYIRRYHPGIARYLTPLLSPLQAHCRLLKERYPGTRVVFFGPCIAKKDEVAAFPDLCDAALTFDDLRQLMKTSLNQRITVPSKKENARFIPEKASDGALYPVDGGMIAGIRNNCTVTDQAYMHFSGMDEVVSVIRSLEHGEQLGPVFLELLACPGGCINGPVTGSADGTLLKRVSVIKSVPGISAVQRQPSMNIGADFPPTPVPTPVFSEDAIIGVLRSTGKYTVEDEQNCGGCGYGNCRDFAQAVLSEKAETSMCVAYMRRLALKKANRLISAMPAGVVIVNSDLTINECNERFAALSGEESQNVFKEIPGMQGAILEKVLPVSHLFRHVFENNEEISGKDIRIDGRVLRCHIFIIESDSIAGGIFNDITDPEFKRDEIIERAQTVIRNNLTTVQKIAYLLGENASETEMVLSSIIDSFKPAEKNDAPKH